MSKRNPLFVDSTKMRGDMTVSQIELVGLSNYFGASVYVKLNQEELAEEQVYHLAKSGESQWKAQARLAHGQDVSFQFFVARDGVVLASSKPKTVPAAYVISDRWHPDPAMEPLAQPSDPAIESPPETEKTEVVIPRERALMIVTSGPLLIQSEVSESDPLMSS